MRLCDLLPPDVPCPPGKDNVEVFGLTSSSASAGAGSLFAGLPGTKVDGSVYATDAIKRGAVAVLIARGKPVEVPSHVALIETDNPRRTLALMSAAFFGAQPEHAVAVTGTSGKTSVADFTRQIFAQLGHRAASLGTIGVVKPDGAVYGSLTTPDPITLHAALAGLAQEGVTHLAFEASSHGLDQHRLDGVRLTAAAFTNLGRDHMDYHATVEDYLAAKLRLFTDLLPRGRTVVVNADGAYAARVMETVSGAGHRVMTVGRAGTTLRLANVAREGFQQVLTVGADHKTTTVRLPLIGAYQIENALVAAGLAIAAGEDCQRALSALEYLKGVPGRLDVAGAFRGGLAIVDYAHKPEALAAALDACRPFATGQLICVFGCGGDRDKGKRPIMGKIAVEKADVVIVTDDNPRTEVPAAIRNEILAGANGAREIGDRAQAIRTAIGLMSAGDVVLVAGKGHETGQIVGGRVVPFSDHDEITRAIESR